LFPQQLLINQAIESGVALVEVNESDRGPLGKTPRRPLPAPIALQDDVTVHVADYTIDDLTASAEAAKGQA